MVSRYVLFLFDQGRGFAGGGAATRPIRVPEAGRGTYHCAPAPLMAGNGELPASTGSKTGSDSTWAEGHSFVNSCHVRP